jgi:hypothetical protein
MVGNFRLVCCDTPAVTLSSHSLPLPTPEFSSLLYFSSSLAQTRSHHKLRALYYCPPIVIFPGLIDEAILTAGSANRWHVPYSIAWTCQTIGNFPVLGCRSIIFYTSVFQWNWSSWIRIICKKAAWCTFLKGRRFRILRCLLTVCNKQYLNVLFKCHNSSKIC